MAHLTKTLSPHHRDIATAWAGLSVTRWHGQWFYGPWPDIPYFYRSWMEYILFTSLIKWQVQYTWQSNYGLMDDSKFSLVKKYFGKNFKFEKRVSNKDRTIGTYAKLYSLCIIYLLQFKMHTFIFSISYCPIGQYSI